MSRPGLDLGRNTYRDIGVVNVVDRDVDPHLVAPVLGERVEPSVMSRHKVAPHEDLECARELGARRLKGRRRTGPGGLRSDAATASATSSGGPGDDEARGLQERTPRQVQTTHSGAPLSEFPVESQNSPSVTNWLGGLLPVAHVASEVYSMKVQVIMKLLFLFLF